MVHNDAKMGIPVLLVIWQSKPAIPRKDPAGLGCPGCLDLQIRWYLGLP
jgi:hypothetical protein